MKMDFKKNSGIILIVLGIILTLDKTNEFKGIVHVIVYYIQEYLNEQSLSQEEFSKRYNIPLEVIKGEQSISIYIAKKLSCIIGASTEYWLNLQKEYDKLVSKGI